MNNLSSNSHNYYSKKCIETTKETFSTHQTESLIIGRAHNQALVNRNLKKNLTKSLILWWGKKKALGQVELHCSQLIQNWPGKCKFTVSFESQLIHTGVEDWIFPILTKRGYCFLNPEYLRKVEYDTSYQLTPISP